MVFTLYIAQNSTSAFGPSCPCSTDNGICHFSTGVVLGPDPFRSSICKSEPVSSGQIR